MAIKTGGTGESETVAGYLLLLLFTGLRRQEGAGLRWQDVDLVNSADRRRGPHWLLGQDHGH